MPAHGRVWSVCLQTRLLLPRSELTPAVSHLSAGQGHSSHDFLGEFWVWAWWA